MVANMSRFRIGLASVGLLVVSVFLGVPTAASAVDCVGPDDPPGCTPVVTPSPTPTPTPTPTPSPSVTPDSVTVVQLDEDQLDLLVWIGGAMLLLGTASLVGSWSR